MDRPIQRNLTALLDDVRAGKEGARDRLTEALYDELRRRAYVLMRRERPGHTLQPSALVHEALIRLFDSDALARAPDRHHLFAAAATAMYRVLVEHARRRGASKRGGGLKRVPLDEAIAYADNPRLDDIALHEALDRLTKLNPRQGWIVTLKFFAGLSSPEIATIVDVSVSTVENDWYAARAFLFSQLEEAF
jgi:RNA polymerase sigma-70 factor, ECF subfamily